MNNSLWTQFFKGEAPFEGRNRFHLNAYSEFMPPPRLGINPYTGEFDPRLLDPQRPSHWRIPEVQEICELRPGLEHIAQIIGDAMSTAMAGGHYKGISQAELAVNPYWPGVRLPHPSAMTMLLPLALSKTQDDKGRVRWTLFGSSQLGPDAAFWKSFFRPDGSELPAKEGIDFLRNFLDISSGEAPSSADGLRNAGLRILPRGSDSVWREPELPTWTKELYLSENDLASGSLKVLLTFKSFSSLPESIKDAARAGKIRLLPSPETLIFWDHRIAKKLEVGLLHATQIPLLLLFLRHEGVGLRIPTPSWRRKSSKSGI